VKAQLKVQKASKLLTPVTGFDGRVAVWVCRLHVVPFCRLSFSGPTIRWCRFELVRSEIVNVLDNTQN
jgi:hypothetical protein